MKNFADLKRRCTLGMVLEVTYHHLDETPIVVHGNTGTSTLANDRMSGQRRQISIVQGNAIAFKMASGRDSWLYWPKAKDVQIDGVDAFSILHDGVVTMSYRFV